MRTPSSRSCFFAAIALLIVTGCGGVDDGRVSISGSVTLDGKPLDGGMIAFIGGGGGALATAARKQFTVSIARVGRYAKPACLAC